MCNINRAIPTYREQFQICYSSNIRIFSIFYVVQLLLQYLLIYRMQYAVIFSYTTPLNHRKYNTFMLLSIEMSVMS